MLKTEFSGIGQTDCRYVHRGKQKRTAAFSQTSLIGGSALNVCKPGLDLRAARHTALLQRKLSPRCIAVAVAGTPT
jgi:hypothetical protein